MHRKEIKSALLTPHLWVFLPVIPGSASFLFLSPPQAFIWWDLNAGHWGKKDDYDEIAALKVLKGPQLTLLGSCTVS